jgi:DNA-binding MarR family transcriptional regulator
MVSMSAQMTEVRWLSADEQTSWRAWITANVLLQERLERDMKAQHGLSMAEYEVMVRLSEAPEHQLRMSELAGRTLASKSRLSHQISRMEDAGLVRRQGCLQDRRGAFAVLTEEGWQALVAAAPDHVATVRAWLVDALTPEEFTQLGALSARVLERLQSGCPAEES